MIKAIIFDFDGVIVESVDIKTKSFKKLFEPYGKEIVKKVIEHHLKNTGVSRFEKFNYIYKNILNRKLTKDKFDSLCKKFSDLVVDEVVKAPYVYGAEEFLYNNIKDYVFFISSATPQDEIKSIIRKRKIDVYFKEVYGSPNSKIEIVKSIILHNNFLNKEIVYIGDSLSDYKAAMDNSINFIARINNNENIFKDIECVKINNLANLENVIIENF